MKKLLLLLLSFSCLFGACNQNTSQEFESDQIIVEEKLEAIRELVQKHELPDSVFQNIARMKEEKIAEFKALDLQVLDEQLAGWAAFKKSVAPYEDRMKTMSEEHRKAWAEIEAETDPEKKAALEEKYWKEIFPRLEDRSKALKEQMEHQQ